ncbi:hypothetical protein RUM43_000135 [Polyplax serrata]|uniref:Uncharacterized protein n=1 Tax=Polyplax serrata TaxID=468196 RepID=A0AAN8XRQ0_POLSC
MSSEWVPLGAKLSRLAPLALSWRKGDKKPKRCPPSQRTVKNRQGLLGVTTDRGDNQGREDFEPTENGGINSAIKGLQRPLKVVPDRTERNQTNSDEPEDMGTAPKDAHHFNHFD